MPSDFTRSLLYPDIIFPAEQQTVLLREVRNTLKNIGKNNEAVYFHSSQGNLNLSQSMDCLSDELGAIQEVLESGFASISQGINDQISLLETIAEQLRKPSELRARELLDQAIQLKNIWEDKHWSLEPADEEKLFKKVEKKFQKVLSIDSSAFLDCLTLTLLAELYYSNISCEESIDCLKQALILAANRKQEIRIQQLIAKIYAITNQNEQAIFYAKKIAWFSTDRHYELVQYLAVSSNPEVRQSAIAELKTLIDTNVKYWYLARHDKELLQIRQAVDNLLSSYIIGRKDVLSKEARHFQKKYNDLNNFFFWTKDLYKTYFKSKYISLDRESIGLVKVEKDLANIEEEFKKKTQVLEESLDLLELRKLSFDSLNSALENLVQKYTKKISDYNREKYIKTLEAELLYIDSKISESNKCLAKPDREINKNVLGERFILYLKWLLPSVFVSILIIAGLIQSGIYGNSDVPKEIQYNFIIIALIVGVLLPVAVFLTPDLIIDNRSCKYWERSYIESVSSRKKDIMSRIDLPEIPKEVVQKAIRLSRK